MTDLKTTSIVPMGTWHHDHTIEFSDHEWQRVPVERLQVGSRFRFEGDGIKIIDWVFYDVLRIIDKRFLQVNVIEIVDLKGKKSFKELSLNASDIVLVVPAREPSFASSGVK